MSLYFFLSVKHYFVDIKLCIENNSPSNLTIINCFLIYLNNTTHDLSLDPTAALWFNKAQETKLCISVFVVLRW